MTHVQSPPSPDTHAPVIHLGWRLPAEAWAEAGFDPDEVEEWLAADCFDPDAARDLADRGVTPETARTPFRTSARRD
jgi:hypothetical protein